LFKLEVDILEHSLITFGESIVELSAVDTKEAFFA